MDKKNIIGIDAGSIALSLVEIDPQGTILRRHYAFHNGDILGHLRKALSEIDPAAIGGIAVTTSTADLLPRARRRDSRIAYIEAARKKHPRMGSLLMVGGERFGLIQFDSRGNYLNYKSNSSCAAGTGSFLDQQARRLNYPSITEFSTEAAQNRGAPPQIASRCAVFAKTDLIHAQQEGYTSAEICDGLCRGLARNLTDTLFTSRQINGPLVFAGGVSRNPAVVNHIEELTRMTVLTDEDSHLYGAYGAALCLLQENQPENQPDLTITSWEEELQGDPTEREYHYSPLRLQHTSYPDFQSLERFDYTPRIDRRIPPVETDIYRPLPSPNSPEASPASQSSPAKQTVPVTLGIDIGSTSTKAALLDGEGAMLAGLYTRTSGRPLAAVQAILDALSALEEERSFRFRFEGAATTGSGRKFIGRIIGADLILDEITAHARAAGELDPEVDTIIEIGGQDAKFTTLRDGRVTFSAMNNVCAAGTGSFIEEQAAKLGVPLSEYADRAEAVSSPLASDRCTVFMERDINRSLTDGFSVDEVLASALHSVRENYLTKVAVPGNIGERIFFQGATAKNRALVAAFEQKLGKPLKVSPYCHLTGAMGCALQLRDQKKADPAPSSSRFRGLELYREEIPVRTEICNLCTNHCKIRVAQVEGETVAYGFLCGRDYQTKKFVSQNRSGFDLLKERRRRFAFRPPAEFRESVTIGLPFALYMVEDMPLWQRFFHNLGIRTVTSEKVQDAVKKGKLISGAEFCAPMAAAQGHTSHLMEQADGVFFPIYLEKTGRDGKERRSFCYYTQYITSVLKGVKDFQPREKILTPLVHAHQNRRTLKNELLRSLQPLLEGRLTFSQISQAYEEAAAYQEAGQEALRSLFRERQAARRPEEIQTVLLGRPYTILNPAMNSRIPEIFSTLGIQAFYQDMLPLESEELPTSRTLQELFPWHYAKAILQAAEYAAQTRGLYPVLITSFKCSPDSFVLPYFKMIMEARKKPYLILQLDEHDSSVGYETRIEAAVRAFRNHLQETPAPTGGQKEAAETASAAGPKDTASAAGPPTGSEPQAPGLSLYASMPTRQTSALRDKTLLLPGWDTYSVPLICSILQGRGYQAEPVEENGKTIFEGLTENTGQCLPLTTYFHNTLRHIENRGLDPARTAAWIFEARVSCNIRMYPFYLNKLIKEQTGRTSQITIYNGDLFFRDFGLDVTMDVYLAFLFGGMLRRAGCRIRPYEVNPGETDRLIAGATRMLQTMFKLKQPKEPVIREIISQLEHIETAGKPRMKVAIFGDLYVRDNDTFNRDLIRTIEAHGGEALTTPYSEYGRIVADAYRKQYLQEGMIFDSASFTLLKETVKLFETKYLKLFKRLLPEADRNPEVNPDTVLSQFDVSLRNSGESMDNLLKIVSLLRAHPDIGLFVQTNPSYCCPSLVTEAMADRIEEETGVPVLTLEYDGTGRPVNEAVIPYLRYPRQTPAGRA